MPRYGYLCANGHSVELVAEDWRDAETNYRCSCNAALIGFAPDSAPALKSFFWEPIKVAGLKKISNGSEIYNSNMELEQEMKEQHKIWNENGIDKDCERYRQEREQENKNKIAKKIEKFIHEMTPSDVSSVINFKPQIGDVGATTMPGIKLSERADID